MKHNQLKVKNFPLLLVAKKLPLANTKYPAQIVFVVSKKRFKKAVNRNKIKRLMREAYRLHKHKLYEHLLQQNQKIVISMVYLGNKPITFPVIEQKIIVLLNELKVKLNDCV